MTERHDILSFDVDKLPQASQHQYVGKAASGLTSVPRAKVPVKDGISQRVSIPVEACYSNF